MHLLDNYSQNFLTTNQEREDAQREQFKIAKVSLVDNKFNITLQNSGQIPINITRLWVQDTTANSISKYDLNSADPPSQTITNVGMNLPLTTVPTDAYDLKLVTSRGNTQDVAVNSAGSAPISIQLLALPSTIPSGFTTELVMIVINNQSGTLTNLNPQITQTGHTASCTPSTTASPPSVSTLAPGNAAIFKWDLKMVGNPNQFCTYVASLQNGFLGNTASATATLTAITATSSNWSTTWGILSINYTTLQWTQDGTTWKNAWSVPCCRDTVWRVNVTNNDPTRSFIYNGNSTLVAFGTSPGSNTATQWYIIKNTYPTMPYGYPTNGQTIVSNSTARLYFGAISAGGTGGQNIGNSAKGQYAVSILLYGYWDSVSTNNFFGQNIPYEGIIIT
ncbi:MAG: hypothetical protein ACREBI_08765 [Nitrosotalea sp.]